MKYEPKYYINWGIMKPRIKAKLMDIEKLFNVKDNIEHPEHKWTWDSIDIGGNMIYYQPEECEEEIIKEFRKYESFKDEYILSAKEFKIKQIIE